MTERKTLRVLITLSAVDVHERAAKYISRKFMEAGYEVLYTRYSRIEEIAMIVMQESVDVVGISFFGGNHVEITCEVKKTLSDNGLDKVLVIVGGDIPEQDYPELKKIGVEGIFGPGTTAEHAIDYIETQIAKP
jgi:methylmalonyl-CoA mutase C-terminal domain/subunit